MMPLVLLGVVHRDPRGKRRLLDHLTRLKPLAVSLEVSPASVRIRNEQGPVWLSLFKQRVRNERRRTHQSLGRLLRGGALRGLWEYLRLPYEYRAALEYAQSQKIPLFLIDDSATATDFLDRVETELLSEDNIGSLIREADGNGLETDVAAQYARARTCLASPQPIPSAGLANNWDAWADREKGLAQRLRLLHQGLTRRLGRTVTGSELAAGLLISPDAIGFLPDPVDFAPGRPHLYVGGWQHLVEDDGQSTLYVQVKDLAPERRLGVDLGA
jgi:hypothetical protein